MPEGLGELGLRVALSVGELDKEAYQMLYDAGAGGEWDSTCPAAQGSSWQLGSSAYGMAADRQCVC